MDDFNFPSSLLVLLDDEDTPVNLVFLTAEGIWVREGGSWVEFVEEEGNPKRQIEDMQLAPVDPRVIDLWDQSEGSLAAADIEPYEFQFQFQGAGE